MSATTNATPLAGQTRTLPGKRLVLSVFAVAAVIAGLVVAVALIAIQDRVDDPVCNPEPAVCTAVNDFVDAFNSGDAARLQELVTAAVMPDLLQSSNADELEARLAAMTDEERIDDFRVTAMVAEGDAATVTARLTVDGFQQEARYRLTMIDGRWIISGY